MWPETGGNTTSGSHLLTWNKFTPAWIGNHMSTKVWEEITYTFLNFIGCTVEVWEWISNFIPHNGYNHLPLLGFKLIHVCNSYCLPTCELLYRWLVQHHCSRHWSCTEMEMSSYWRNIRQCLQEKLSFENFRCNHWQKFHQNRDIVISVGSHPCRCIYGVRLHVIVFSPKHAWLIKSRD